ncbi:MAG: pyruvate decarboxylase/indolepyruvate decarboxylase [Waddliaceae bacterium]|nr:pyruvate decarboxylase/indolepyruvate decarboxylase [Waddliaceae bacterium]
MSTSSVSKDLQALETGNYLLDFLWELGVREIFGVPGDYVIHFNKVIEEHKIRFINTTTENSAGYMADTYARFKGLGVACTTYGVGMVMANSIAQAYVESSPVVIISGSASEEEFQRAPCIHHYVEDSYTTQLEVFKPITVDQAVLNDPKTAAEDIHRVLNNCLLHKRPVYIELPRNMVDIDLIPHQYEKAKEKESNPKQLKQALDAVYKILSKSQNPVFWLGHDITRYQLSDLATSLAEQFQIPICSTVTGKTCVDETHPLYAGVYQGKVCDERIRNFVESSDCLLSIGALWSDVNTGMFTAQLDHLEQIRISAREIQIGKEKYDDIYFVDLLQAIQNAKWSFNFQVQYPRLDHNAIKSYQASPNSPSKTASTLSCIQKYLSDEHIICCDIGDCLFASTELVLSQNSYISSSYFGTLGFAVPAAIATQLCYPEKRAIAMVGDGSFQMTATELSTAVRFNLDPIIIVLNNHGYGTERPLIEGEYNDIWNWNYAQLPSLFGKGKGVRVETETAFEDALKLALSTRGEFFLIEVELEQLDLSGPLQRLSTASAKIV